MFVMCTRMYLYKNEMWVFLDVLVVNHFVRLSLTDTAAVFVNLFKEVPIVSHRFCLLKCTSVCNEVFPSLALPTSASANL